MKYLVLALALCAVLGGVAAVAKTDVHQEYTQVRPDCSECH